jgi:ParB/RepB/Spo0J family partition protein
MPELMRIAVEKLVGHPQNPRLLFREDVVAGICASLNGEMSEVHALRVRPIDGGLFQIVAGHQRLEAGRRKGLKALPCWVEEMTDEEAYMALVLDNRQGELSPLEIGIHALEVVGKKQGKKGQGLQQYADQIGVSRQYVSQLVQAAEVATTSQVDLRSLTDRCQHLVAIHALPKSLRPEAVQHVLAKGLSVSETEEAVKLAKNHLAGEPFADWQDFLPHERCALAAFCGKDPGTFRRLHALAIDLLERLKEHEDLATQWRAWLMDNREKNSWDMKKCQEKRMELDQARMDRDLGLVEADKVQVLLADPPWQYDFVETDGRQVENQYPTATVEEIIGHKDDPGLFPPLADDCVLFLWATAPKLREALQVMEGWGFEYKTHAVWDKEKIGMGYWFRGQHELLLVGVRGEFSPPEQANRVSSVFREARTEHSAKPECVYLALEKMFPGAVKWELYRRKPRVGWGGSGYEDKSANANL